MGVVVASLGLKGVGISLRLGILGAGSLSGAAAGIQL